ncbi:CPBP family intramembrane glutamic endopeptidase [Methanolobus bombayensis]|uniref:CPBP family intramembrane glutamic endopeptidase n=1 Tax=Methanolobus bombayensis TaxID=38023 RepID=UPI001AE38804|nr:CPBP family intramembrane glutamic endopeptidase [Methanolobus bombayensis]MBP1910219.1 membrane protease YdiL (CAAX protease family) [Methanolobus bombayensis]
MKHKKVQGSWTFRNSFKNVHDNGDSAVPGLTDTYIISVAILMIILAELLLYSSNYRAGITLHVITLISLSVSSIWIDGTHVARSLQVLTLLPILRLLNMSMPIFSEMTIDLYVYIYAPLAVPVYLVIRHQNISKETLGVQFRNVGKYIPLALIVGLIIAQGEYFTIDAGNLIPDLSIGSLFKISLIMIFFVGLVEEIVFRSLIQTRLSKSFGNIQGLIFASILFGVMHSGYGTIYEILFTGFAGLIFGYMFQKTNSLPFVALAHGFVNIFLFGIIPLLT